jgi:hypothetical protein
MGDDAMAAKLENGNGWRTPLRIAAWTGAALLLAAPVVAMQLTDEMNWTASDFIFAGVMVLGTTGLFDLAARKSPSFPYLAGVAGALGAAFLLIWVTGAVGIIGDEGGPNALYAVVLAIGALGAVLARFKPSGLARAMLAAGLVQAGIGGLALALGWGGEAASYPWDILGATAFFTALWLVSAALFHTAARGEPA